MNKPNIRVEDMGRGEGTLSCVCRADQPLLPPPYDRPENIPAFKPLGEKARQDYMSNLDDTIAVSIPKPKSKEEEDVLIAKFLTGLQKLFTAENNWTFLMPLKLSMEHCAKCNTCSEACHIYEESGRNELYRPLYRSDVLRRLYYKYLTPGGSLLAKWRHGDIDLNWTTISRLIELSYRCNLCRRCAQTCPIGVDNGLITHELRKLFSQEMGIAAKEIHDRGAVLQLKVGSSTGMSPEVVKDNIDFIDEDTSEKVGFEVKTPWDKKGADFLLTHNAGEIMAWPENHGAFAALLNKAGVNWTLSSAAMDSLGYDNINYGLWYDDFMFAKVAIKHAMAAKNLGVKKIVLGECGHAHKALTIIADRVLTGDLNIPRESCFPLMRDIMNSGVIQFDPSRNNFPVTLHDPCNFVRLMGIVQPQRDIVKKLCPQFREMEPHGVNNYCCGGGSGFAIMSAHNFSDWRMHVSGRKKFEQILNAFQDSISPDINKYVCAPCSNCKGQIRDLLNYYDAWNKAGITYGGLVEVMINAMVDAKPGYLEFGQH